MFLLEDLKSLGLTCVGQILKAKKLDDEGFAFKRTKQVGCLIY